MSDNAQNARRLPRWATITLIVVAVALAATLWQLTLILAFVVAAIAVVSFVSRKPTPLQLTTPKRRIAALGTAFALAFVASVGAAATSHDRSDRVEAANFATVPTAKPTPLATTQAKPSPTPAKPTPVKPTPVTEVKREEVPVAIDFERTTTEDWNLAEGTHQVTVPGVPGQRVVSYDVTYVDGVESGRVEVANVVTVEPVAEVTAIGKYVAPVPFAGQAAPNDGCDPNYADACVPIASDVDCAWGKGDGPAYFDGVARVVGVDIYGLDRDGDGLACERN